MLEVVLIMCIVQACLFMPLRGKDFEQLSPAQQQRVEKNFDKYMRTRRGKKNPYMGIEEYLTILQRNGLVSLIAAIVVLPAYVYVIYTFYLNGTIF